MAEVKVGILVSDNGSTAKVNKDAASLRKNLEGAASAAKSIKASPTLAAAKAGSESGLSRGATGVGGGNDSKDFARQAQGLGGLVHVYATFAANIFAVTAAFSALSKAADYTNMVEGLNQLGAASGKNLGTMAKNMSILSDGALSLKAAMEATAQGSAAGLTGKQMEQMTLVAKKASQALGRDMGDALSRLSRGITKIEPELIDELGIMVKVDRATQDYARTIGKTVTSLTDFERRQAYANAALKEGLDKFGGIEIDANPFTKLQAGFINLLYSGGELLNKVLGPIAKMLGESPLALGAVMAGITTMLVSKAIPALSNWRNQLEETAKFDKLMAQKKLADADKSGLAVAQHNMRITEQMAEVELAEVQKHQDKLRSLKESTGKKVGGKKALEILGREDVKTITDKELLHLQTVAARELKKGNVEVADSYNKSAEALRNYREAERAYTVSREKAVQATLKETSALSTYKQLRMASAQADRAYASRKAASTAVEVAALEGPTAGFKKLHEEVQKSRQVMESGARGVGVFGASMTYLKGSIGIATMAITNFVNAFGWITMVIGAVVGVVSLLNSVWSENAKEAEAFAKSITTSADAIEGAGRTISWVSKKGDIFKTENVQAYANALNEVSGAFSTVVDTFTQNSGKVSGIWDTAKDFWAHKAGKGMQDEAQASALGTIQKTLQLVDPSKLNEVESTLKGILGVTDLSKTSINKMFDGLDREDSVAVLSRLDIEMKKINSSTMIGAASLTEFKDSLKQISKDYESFTQSLASSDPFAKLGASLISMTTALVRSTDKLKSLSDLLKDDKVLSQLPPGLQGYLKGLGNGPISAQSNIESSKKTLVGIEKDYNERLAEYEQHSKVATEQGMGSSKESREALEYLKMAEKAKADYTKKLGISEAEAKKYGETISTVINKGFEQSVVYIDKAYNNVAQVAAATFQSIVMSGLQGAGAPDAQYNLKVQEIGVQRELIRATIALNDTMFKVQLESEISRSKEGSPERIAAQTALTLFKAGSASMGAALKNDNYSAEIKSKLAPEYQRKKAAEGNLLQLGAQSRGAAVSRDIGRVGEEGSQAQKDIDIKIKSLSIERERREVLASYPELYNENLAAQRILDLEKLQGYQIDKEYQTYETKWNQDNIRLKSANAQNQLAIIKTMNQDTINYNNSTSHTMKENSDAVLKIEMDNLDKLQKAQKRVFDLEQRRMNITIKNNTQIYDTMNSLNDMLAANGKLTDSALIKSKADIDLAKENMSVKQELAILEQSKKGRIIELDKQILSAQGNADAKKSLLASKSEELKLYEGEKQSIIFINNLKKEQIKLQSDHQVTLVKTEDTMRSIERGGAGGFDKYMGALSDDFSNKLTQMIKAAKSAGDTFNQGLITGIDAGIDELYKAIQTSTLTLKGTVKYIRNALSDVFRDTAAQILKNSWKEVTKAFLPQTEADKSALAMTVHSSAMQQHSMALATAGRFVTSTSSLNKTTAELTATGQESFIDKLLGSMGMFGQAIQIFLSAINSFSISGAMKGASEGSGFLGTIGGFFKGMFGGGEAAGVTNALTTAADASMFLLARGGVLSGARGLSQYSNSVVDSPTMFAFAKGGVPPSKGLMGEAGSEAIMPLRRDSRGNLGVSGGGGITNTIEINITVENGKADSNTLGDASTMAGQLGNAIKLAVNQELLKQTRPGGLLAR